MSTQATLQGGSVLLDSLLYEEETVPANLWLDDEYLLVRVSESGFDAMARSLWAAASPPQLWYRTLQTTG